MNGLSGLGVSETASTDLFNRYLSQQGSIDTAHNTASSDLLKNYITDRRVEEDRLYEEAKDAIDNYRFTDSQSLDNYLNGLRGSIGNDRMSLLDMYAKVAKETLDKNKEAEKTSEVVVSGLQFNNNYGATGLKSGDNFTVTDSEGRILKVESRGQVTDSSLIDKAEEISNGAIFGYNNNVYLKRNGKIYLIGGRGGDDDNDEYTELFNAVFSGNKISGSTYEERRKAIDRFIRNLS